MRSIQYLDSDISVYGGNQWEHTRHIQLNPIFFHSSNTTPRQVTSHCVKYGFFLTSKCVSAVFYVECSILLQKEIDRYLE